MNKIFIDIECTCWDKDDSNALQAFSRSLDGGKTVETGYLPPPQEIIQLGIILVNNNEEKSYNQYVKPLLNPKLSDFCRNLTGITQEQINQSELFGTTWKKLRSTIRKPCILYSWGDYDNRIIVEECKRHLIEYPFCGHINVKKLFADCLLCKPCGVEMALKRLGLEFEGKPHNGYDDIINIYKIYQTLCHQFNIK